MLDDKRNILSFTVIILLSCFLWFFIDPSDLSEQAWHLFVIFITSMVAILCLPLPTGVVTSLTLTTLILTDTLTTSQALSGFSNKSTWLVVIVFLLARALINSGLGARIAYTLISKLGGSTLGLSYSLLLTDFLISPVMPSTAARGGGIIYPIASALAKVYENPAENDFKQNKMGAYLMQLCLQGNVITGAIFLTAMVGNALIFGTAKTMGYNYSWFDWAIAAIVPGCINLLLLPFIIAYLLPSSSTDHTTIPALAKMELRKMGKLHIKEILVILNFGLLIILWMLGDKLGIDATAAAFVGFALFLLSGVLKWDTILKEKTAWETLMWFGTLIMLSDCLNQFQIMNWATTEMELIVSGQHNFVALIILALVYFYSHYFFASVTIHMTALFSSFFILFIKLGVPPFVAAMSLAMFSNLSGGLTHYTTTPAPLYFSSNYMTVSKWCRVGIIVSIVNLSIWLVIAPLWWKLLGWW